MEKLGKSWMVKMIERENEVKATGNMELALQHIEDLKGTLQIRNNTINELREEIRTFQDNSKEKESTKEESFQSEIIIYIMLGLAFIICTALMVFMWQMRKSIGKQKA